MRKPVPILVALLAHSGCGGAAREEPAVAAATVRLAAVPGRPAAGYFSLRIDGERGALLAVRSSRAGRIEMHETRQHGGMSSMRPIARLPVQEGEKLSLTPGGRHLMIYDLDRDVSAGGRIDLVLDFERGADQTLPAEIVPPDGHVDH